LAVRADAALGSLGRGAQGFFQPLLGQTLAGLDIGRITLPDRMATVQAQEGLNLTDDLTAGGFGFEQLPNEAFEGQAQVEDAIATVGPSSSEESSGAGRKSRRCCWNWPGWSGGGFGWCGGPKGPAGNANKGNRESS